MCKHVWFSTYSVSKIRYWLIGSMKFGSVVYSDWRLDGVSGEALTNIIDKNMYATDILQN